MIDEISSGGNEYKCKLSLSINIFQEKLEQMQRPLHKAWG
jgi:hypothetical protein